LDAVLRKLAPADQLSFFSYLATGFAPDAMRLSQAAKAYLSDPSPAAAQRLAEAAEPPRQELLRRMNMSPSGTATLVAMRRTLLEHVKERPELHTLDADLHHLLSSWFNRGFLELRRIDWRTSAAVLEKLIVHEAVHEIDGWDDLRRRLAADRRCFAFFHPALPGEPLIFVEVALVQGLASAVQPLLEREGASCGIARADTAIFYSISNCQDGLRGISFGNFLIKQVVEELTAELPQVIQFATLSPVPGFRRWLERQPNQSDDLLTADERAALAGAESSALDSTLLPAMLKTENWWEVPKRAEALAGPLTRLCALYLTTSGPEGALDPVARFHLGNGARLERINWLGNRAARGIRESFGLMVNYLYDLDSIEANHEAYVRDGTIVRSEIVEMLLAPQAKAPSSNRARRARARVA
jgi:malonyl-CoA decarboxylase